MAGFLGTTTSFSIFEAPVPSKLDFEAVRAWAFSDAVTPEGTRLGWVGLGNAVDTDFSFGIDHGRFAALSLRVDSRKASGAALKQGADADTDFLLKADVCVMVADLALAIAGVG